MELKSLMSGSDLRGVAMPGVAGEDVNLTPDIAARIGHGFLAWLATRSDKEMGELVVSVGRDSRLSGPSVAAALVTEFSACGAHVIDCGMASTPAMFMSCVMDVPRADGAIMVTASHLPWNRNGLKFFTRDGGVEATDLADIIALAEKGVSTAGSGGVVESMDLLEVYAAHLRGIITRKLGAGTPLAGLAVVVDAGNGAGGFYATDVLAPLGADITGSQFLDPDGHFPNHFPNPENAEAMASVMAAAVRAKADLGIIFDTDVDRAMAVDEQGRAIDRDLIVAAAARLVAEEHPGTTVVTDSVVGDELTEFLEETVGVRHFRYRRGYRNVINKMHELNAQGADCALAIETSGHAAFLDNYSLDDGAYLATLVVCAAAKLKAQGVGVSELVRGLKRPAESRELRMRITEEDFRSKGKRLLEHFAAWAANEASRVASELAGGEVNVFLVEPNYEGVRLTFAGAVRGWALLRMSLHDPTLPLNYESAAVGGCDVIAATIRSFLVSEGGVDYAAL